MKTIYKYHSIDLLYDNESILAENEFISINLRFLTNQISRCEITVNSKNWLKTISIKELIINLTILEKFNYYMPFSILNTTRNNNIITFTGLIINRSNLFNYESKYIGNNVHEALGYLNIFTNIKVANYDKDFFKMNDTNVSMLYKILYGTDVSFWTIKYNGKNCELVSYPTNEDTKIFDYQEVGSEFKYCDNWKFIQTKEEEVPLLNEKQYYFEDEGEKKNRTLYSISKGRCISQTINYSQFNYILYNNSYKFDNLSNSVALVYEGYFVGEIGDKIPILNFTGEMYYHVAEKEINITCNEINTVIKAIYLQEKI